MAIQTMKQLLTPVAPAASGKPNRSNYFRSDGKEMYAGAAKQYELAMAGGGGSPTGLGAPAGFDPDMLDQDLEQGKMQQAQFGVPATAPPPFPAGAGTYGGGYVDPAMLGAPGSPGQGGGGLVITGDKTGVRANNMPGGMPVGNFVGGSNANMFLNSPTGMAGFDPAMMGGMGAGAGGAGGGAGGGGSGSVGGFAGYGGMGAGGAGAGTGAVPEKPPDAITKPETGGGGGGGDSGYLRSITNINKPDAPNVSSLTTASAKLEADANKRNQKRLKDLNKSIVSSQRALGTDYEGMMAELANSDQYQQTLADEEAKKQQGELMQQMVSRGLGGTTVLPSLQAQINRNTGIQKQNIRSNAVAQRLGVLGQRSGAIEGTRKEGRNITQSVTDLGPQLQQLLPLLMSMAQGAKG